MPVRTESGTCGLNQASLAVVQPSLSVQKCKCVVKQCTKQLCVHGCGHMRELLLSLSSRLSQDSLDTGIVWHVFVVDTRVYDQCSSERSLCPSLCVCPAPAADSKCFAQLQLGLLRQAVVVVPAAAVLVTPVL